MGSKEVISLKSTAEAKKIESEFLALTRPTSYELNLDNDVLTQFRMNLSQVEESHARLRFLLHEVNSLIKK